MRTVLPLHGPRTSLALLILRVVVGAAFIAHGSMKLTDPTGWAARMIPGTPAWLQALVVVAEFGGGIALIGGFLTPLFAFLIACDMAVAILRVHIPSGAQFVGGRGAFELPLLYLTLMVALLLTGPGMFSIDGLLARRARRSVSSTSQAQDVEMTRAA